MANFEETELERTCVEAIIGKPAANRVWESAVIIQGPYSATHTPIVIDNFLERNSSAVLLIVSTYFPGACKSVDSFLNQKHLNILSGREAIHSGRLVFIFVNPPPKTDESGFWKTNYWNQNLHRLTTFVGLRYADQLGILVSLKCRSDCFLGMRNINRWLFDNFLIRIPPIPPARSAKYFSSKMRGRIVVSDHAKSLEENPHQTNIGKHFVPDFWSFGFTRDLMAFFDIRSSSAWNGGLGIRIDSAAETHLAETWMKSVGIDMTPDGVIELTARYLGIASSVEVEMVALKFEFNYFRYLEEGKSYLRGIYENAQRLGILITCDRWLSSIEKYRSQDAIIIES